MDVGQLDIQDDEAWPQTDESERVSPRRRLLHLEPGLPQHSAGGMPTRLVIIDNQDRRGACLAPEGLSSGPGPNRDST